MALSTEKRSIKVVPPPRLVCIEVNPGPGKMSDGKRERIIGFLEANGTPTAAAEEYEVGRPVYDLKNKVEETGSVKTRPGQGRKRKLSRKNKRAIRMKALSGKEIPQITREINAKLDEP